MNTHLSNYDAFPRLKLIRTDINNRNNYFYLNILGKSNIIYMICSAADLIYGLLHAYNISHYREDYLNTFNLGNINGKSYSLWFIISGKVMILFCPLCNNLTLKLIRFLWIINMAMSSSIICLLFFIIIKRCKKRILKEDEFE